MTRTQAELRVIAKWAERLHGRTQTLTPAQEQQFSNFTRGAAGYLRMLESALNAPARETRGLDRRIETARRIAQEASA